MDEYEKQSAPYELATIDSEQNVSALFASRRLPRSYHWLYHRCDDYARAHMPSVLDCLAERNVIAANGDGTWTHVEEPLRNSAEEGTDGRPFVPQWEMMLGEYLEKKGVFVQYHRQECGYTLGIAMTAFAAKMNVEVDGRQHETLPSQRARDIARDKRLTANGWAVMRLTIAEVITDVATCGDLVSSAWKQLKDGGTV